MTASLLTETTEGLQQLLNDVLALYNGHLLGTDDEGEYQLIFESTESDADATFRAACSVHLARRLAARLSPMRVELGSRIELGEADQTARCPAGTVILQKEAAASDLLQQRLVLEPLEEPFGSCALKGFRQPFASLLERQYEQLRNMRA